MKFDGDDAFATDVQSLFKILLTSDALEEAYAGTAHRLELISVVKGFLPREQSHDYDLIHKAIQAAHSVRKAISKLEGLGTDDEARSKAKQADVVMAEAVRAGHKATILKKPADSHSMYVEVHKHVEQFVAKQMEVQASVLRHVQSHAAAEVG